MTLADIPLEVIRDDADAAMSKIGHNPDRLAELDDDDLTAVALHAKTLLPIAEATLVSFCNGDVAKANDALTRVQAFPQGKLLRLVRDATAAMKTHRNASLYQHAALLINATVGVEAVNVELERRQFLRRGVMN